MTESAKAGTGLEIGGEIGNAGFDPARERLGEVYAQALLGVTEKAGNSDAVIAEFESLLVDVLDKLPQLRATLYSLRVSDEDKIKLLDKAFAGKMSVTLLNFLKVLARHQRLDSLRVIFRAVQKRYNAMRGRVEVFVTSAAPISNPLMEQIRSKLTGMLGRDVILKVSVDPQLLGGITVRVGDTVYDSSLRTQLRRMKEEALARTEEQIRQSSSRFTDEAA